jgi:hypothetical protein
LLKCSRALTVSIYSCRIQLIRSVINLASRPFSPILLSAERELTPIRVPVQVKKPFALDVGGFSSRPGTALSHFVTGSNGSDFARALVRPIPGRARPRKLFTGFGGSEHGTLRGMLLFRKSVRPQEILLTLSIVPLQLLDYYVLFRKVGRLEGFVTVRSGRLYYRISIRMLIVDLYIIHFYFQILSSKYSIFI